MSGPAIDFIKKCLKAGLPCPPVDVEKFLAQVGGLPVPDPSRDRGHGPDRWSP